jgi:hypothetical protein
VTLDKCNCKTATINMNFTGNSVPTTRKLTLHYYKLGNGYKKLYNNLTDISKKKFMCAL